MDGEGDSADGGGNGAQQGSLGHLGDLGHAGECAVSLAAHAGDQHGKDAAEDYDERMQQVMGGDGPAIRDACGDPEHYGQASDGGGTRSAEPEGGEEWSRD